jgi:hypothetical protein
LALTQAPRRRTFLKECTQALVDIVGASVLCHDCHRQVIGSVFVELNPSVGRFLAN